MDWLRATFRTDPHWSTFWAGVALAFVFAAFRFVRSRHTEFVTLRRHVRDEEAKLWPQVGALREAAESNHAEVLQKLNAHTVMLAEHAVQIRELKDRMPNGEIEAMHAALDGLISRIDGWRKR